MSTQTLINQLLDRHVPAENVVTVLHELLDDASAEQSEPVGVAHAAAITGLSTATLRYYETEGLVRPGRDPSGYRAYQSADLRRLVFLTRMRLSGMGMKELKRYISLVEQGEHTIPERRQLMTAQQERIRVQLRELHLALTTTEYKIAAYDGAPVE